jgi:hypothetical protein
LLAVAEARQRAGSVSTRGTAAAAETTTAILVVAVGGGKTREVEGITVGGASSKQSSYHVSSANLGALPEIAVTHPPDTFCAVYGRA